MDLPVSFGGLFHPLCIQAIENERRAVELKKLDVPLSCRCDSLQSAIRFLAQMEFQIIIERVEQSGLFGVAEILPFELVAGVAGINEIICIAGAAQ